MPSGANVAQTIGKVVFEALVNVLAPLLIYTLLHDRYGDAQALIAASGPPLAWSIIEFIWRRKLDAVALLVLAGIALSLLAFFGGGGVKALQLREKLVTGLIGLIFLGSVAIGRPLIYVLARATIARTNATRAAAFATLQDDRPFQRAILIMTLAWGFGLVGECALAVALTYVISPGLFLIVGPVVGYGMLAVWTAWTIWYARRRIGPAIVAAEVALKDKGAA
jgi:hypothetical protein